MTENQVRSVIDEAIKICRDCPELTWTQAIEKAKEMMRDEKEGLC